MTTNETRHDQPNDADRALPLSQVPPNHVLPGGGEMNDVPSLTWQRLGDAAAYAFRIHGQQVRKGTTTPYISHLLGVASLVLENGDDEDQAIAGMLHDAIEDCGAEHEAIIGDRFGRQVAAIVRACTDADTFPKPPWSARKEAYLRHLERTEPDVLLVSCADKVHNARAIVTDLKTHGPAMLERFKAGAEGTVWYYGALAEVFARRLPSPSRANLRRRSSRCAR